MKVLQMKTEDDGTTGTKGGAYLSGCITWEHENLEPDTTYACVMIPLLEGYRLVTDKELAKYDKPIGEYKFLVNGNVWEDGNLGAGHNWVPQTYIYAVPTDFTFEKPIPDVHIVVDGNSIQLSDESVKAILKEIQK